MEIIEFANQASLFMGIWLAIYGIDSWRRAHIGTRQIELAEETLALFYEASDVIKQIRHPIGYSNETEDIARNEGESEVKFEARKNASIVFYRYNKHQALFSKIHASRYRFMAQIGKEEAKPFDELHNLVMEIIIAARMLSRLWAVDNHRTIKQSEDHRKKIEKYEAVFWDGSEEDEDDPINPELEKIIKEIESTCQKIISGKGTLYGVLNIKLGKK